MQRHEISRIRHEPRRRSLTVEDIRALTPRMVRVTLSSPELHDFVSLSFDDHVKLIFPPTDAGPRLRDFTPRAFDRDRGTLVIDFALHEAGPAMDWAASAQAGATLTIGGPRGSVIVPDDFDWYLLVGDETALPAIGRRVEELRAGVPVATAVVVADAAETQVFESRARWTPHWIERGAGTDDAASLRSALAAWQPPAGDGFIWIAAEAAVAREIRRYVHEERGHPKQWTKAAGYWKRGEADAGERIED